MCVWKRKRKFSELGTSFLTADIIYNGKMLSLDWASVYRGGFSCALCSCITFVPEIPGRVGGIGGVRSLKDLRKLNYSDSGKVRGNRGWEQNQG